MRRPFKIKNGIEDENRTLDSFEEGLSFEESYGGAEEGVLERPGELKSHSRILALLAGLVAAVLLGRLYYLAVIQHDRFLAIADENRLRIEYLPAPRGVVYDQSGQVLAGNRPSFELVAVPLDLPADQAERDEVVERVAAIVGISREDIVAAIEDGGEQEFRSVLIKQNVERSVALSFHEQALDLPGFRMVNTPIRDYYNSTAYAHLLGYVGKVSPEEYEDKSDKGYLFNDSIGKTGLESVYEQFLRGTFGQRQTEVDARGAVKEVFGERQPRPGQNVFLNIEAGLQDAIYQALTERLSAIGKKKAAVIAMDPRDGRVLAFISLPAYDNNAFAEGIATADYNRLANDRNQPLFNRAIRGVYPPGSTVKPMVALAALQEGVISENTVIDDEGYIVIENIYGGPDSFFYGFNRRALGPVRVRQAIADSSDVFFYIVGGGYEPADQDGLGITRLAEYYNRFKIGETLGIDLPGEKPGLVPTPEWKASLYPDDPSSARWYLGNTYHAAIGQGDVLASPLHVLSWTATIANDGKIVRPFVLDRVEDLQGEVLMKQEPETIGDIGIDEQYLRIIQEGMRQTVTNGTAASLNSLPIAVAGKTGSAQFDASDPSRSHAWFAGYAPYDDPQIAIVVLIEDGGIGANNAAPVARAAFQWWADNKIGN